MDRLIYSLSEKEGSIDVETKVFFTEDNLHFEIYQYLFDEEKKFSESEIICNCVRVSSSNLIKIIKLAAEIVVHDASKNESSIK